MRSISEREAYDLIAKGLAFKLTSNRERAKGIQLEIEMASRSEESPTFLTRSDMERNAEAVADRKKCRASRKVKIWPEIHDTYAVTIVAGRGAWIPSTQAAADRVAAMASV